MNERRWKSVGMRRVVTGLAAALGLALAVGCTRPPTEPSSVATPTPMPVKPAIEAIIHPEQISAELDPVLAKASEDLGCPDGMAGIPAGSVDTKWTVTPGGDVADRGEARPVEAFCIDRYEYPNERMALPRAKVNYIEAVELCRKAGKRLCREDEWELACAGPAARAYSYGVEKEPWRCNTDGVETGSDEFLAASGSHPGCRNAYGVYDLNGNLSEWVDKRVNGNGAVVRGGTMWRAEYGQSCYSRHRHGTTERWVDDGFRCCADPPASEP
ncbi:MAG: SUMF1/EgtB/PvdO family nonheme iron enzyme [Deltaproteobacteria bacterium]|nr:SUMF1/EgtB/PvdO family nonheme iron enzyme [Deltaproteobacteria bacterium]